MIEQTLYFAMASNFLFMLPLYRNATRRTGTSNPWLNRKPFSCIFCMTFWIAFVSCVFIPLIATGGVLCFAWLKPCFCAPVLAVLIQKVINALPTTI